MLAGVLGARWRAWGALTCLGHAGVPGARWRAWGSWRAWFGSRWDEVGPFHPMTLRVWQQVGQGGTVQPHENWGVGNKWNEVAPLHLIKTKVLGAGGTRWDRPTP